MQAPQIPAPYYAVISAALTLAIAIAHMRGNDIPLLSGMLRAIGGCVPAQPVAPAPAAGVVAPQTLTGGLLPRTSSSLRPGQRLLVRILAPEALRDLANSRPFNAADKAMLLHIADMRDRDLVAGVEDDLDSHPEAKAAIAADPVPNQPHPLRYWFTHGGAQWIYEIAKIIASALGYKLPDLPPLPAPPPLPSA